MSRIKYYYNTETCEFEKASFNFRRLLKTILSYSAVATVFAIAFVGVRFYVYDNPKEKALKNEVHELKSSRALVEQEISQLEADLQILHQKDNEVYRTMMGIDEISPGKWNGGTGGTAEIKSHSHNSMEDLEEKLNQIKTKTMIQSQSFAELNERVAEMGDELSHMPSILPIKGRFVSGFGMRMHPILKIKRPHTGLDFAAEIGTEIYATADGKVSFAGVHKNGYGIHVNIDHGYGFASKYAHMSKLNVKKGEKVKRGDLIGWSGNTGLSKGPHLHYEVSYNGKKINPIDYFYSELLPEEYLELKKESQQFNESLD